MEPIVLSMPALRITITPRRSVRPNLMLEFKCVGGADVSVEFTMTPGNAGVLCRAIKRAAEFAAS